MRKLKLHPITSLTCLIHCKCLYHYLDQLCVVKYFHGFTLHIFNEQSIINCKCNIHLIMMCISILAL